ncbi:T9SS type A sorting domain-containing protein [Flavobacterium amniphilum]|uniref:T9SS type A sorting domain-containing protein n=1 Tax=Flavobacterium amniphilum TaxID=1834035 RepID=UPI00202AA5FE|nr:T9SS type A sorting domain-containing protein [Flavobacterium amniphilum]MCL9807594.1 T9SS type A sorting domain-containing protein [Flavobacterium amniphilum]
MKKSLYFLLINFFIWNYGQAQIFQEDFETVNPEYGTNIYSSNMCPSISFIRNNPYNQKVDCLTNWRTFKGTPSIEVDNGNTCLSLSSQNFLGNYTTPPYTNPYVLTESVYIDSYKLEPHTNYRFVYYVKAGYSNVNGLGRFYVVATDDELDPYYYYGYGSPCMQGAGDLYVLRVLDSYAIPQNGTSGWEMRTVYFSTEGDTDTSTLLFLPMMYDSGSSSTKLTVLLDNVSLYKEGECESKTVNLQNKIISPTKFNPNPTIEGKRIYAGRAVVASSVIPNGDVVVKPNGILNLKSTYKIDLEDGFIVEEGGIFDAYVDGSCYRGYGTYKEASDDGVEEEIISDNPAVAASEVIIYPNPSNGQFVLNATTDIDEIIIYNALGQVVKGIVDAKNKSTVEVNLTNKIKGVYFLKIRSGNEWTDKKIIVE